MKSLTIAHLKQCAISLWPSVNSAIGAIDNANGTLSSAYLALCQNRPESVTLAQVRNYVPQGWQSKVTQGSFESALREANAFLVRFTKSDASTVVNGESIGENVQDYLARFGSIRKADQALKDVLGVAKQTKSKSTKSKSTKSTKSAPSAKVLPSAKVDAQGRDVRADILAVFREMALSDAQVLLSECQDILAKRQEQSAKVVTSKRQTKSAKVSK